MPVTRVPVSAVTRGVCVTLGERCDTQPRAVGVSFARSIDRKVGGLADCRVEREVTGK